MAPNLKKQYERIIMGTLNYTFSILGANMLFSRLKQQYKADPSAGSLTKSLSEVDAFVTKYETILANDFSNLSKM